MSLLHKIWEGDVVYQEPVCFSENADGTPVGGQLLYTPIEIIQITSFDGKTVYKAGVDYTLKDNCILRSKNSDIPWLPRSIYCRPYTGQPETTWVRLPGGLNYMEVVSDIYRYQVLVTYRHKGSWNGMIPKSERQSLPHTLGVLGRRAHLNLVFYGDSITAGWEASGCNEDAIDMVSLKDYHVVLHHPPYMPSWAELVTRALRKQYPNTHIHKFNRAAGGSTTGWGREHAARLVNPCRPDLVILGFGMNSMQDSPEQYKFDIEQIISEIRAEYPYCEFLLVSPMIPNPEIAGFQNNRLLQQQEVLLQLSQQKNGIALAPVHSVFLELTRLGKHYLELTGNCINHPNDFSVRIYAQTILAVLGL